MAKLNIRNRNAGKIDKEGKPKAPNWEYRFEGAKVDGKRKQITKAGFRTKKEAEIAGTKALAEYNNAGLRFEPSEMSYADYLDWWFDSYVRTSLKYETQLSYHQVIENHVKSALGHYRLKSLSPMQLQEYVNKKFTAGNLKKSTLTNIMTVISGSLSYAVLPAQLLQASPADHLKYPKLDSNRTEVNRTVISVEDYNRIIAKFEDKPHFKVAIMVGWYAGLRIGETFGLTWRDIDFEKKTITVNKQIYKRNYGLDVRDAYKKKGKKEEKSAWYFGDPKTVSSNRTILVSDILLKELKAYRKSQLKNRLEYGEYYTKIYKRPEKDEKGNEIFRLIECEAYVPVALDEADMVFRKENGEFISKDSFKYPSRIIHYDLNIQFNYHSLRHTHATKLIEAGASPKSVQARLGHDSIQTTLQTYVHDTEAMEQDAVDIFDRAVNHE